MSPRRRAHRGLALLVVVVAAATVAIAPAAAPSAADSNEAPGAPGIFQAITAGGDHTCVEVAGGALRCWGGNAKGQLGHGNTTAIGHQVGEMTAGNLAVDLGTGRSARSVSAGKAFTCAVLDDHSVKCWGWGRWAQLGQGNQEWRGDGPGEMGDSLAITDVGPGRTILTLTAGDAHVCAVLDDHTVRCWGRGDRGQLGNGTTLQTYVPQATDLGTGVTPVALALGALHTCALLSSGRVKCWGANDVGQLGLGDTSDRGDVPGEMGDALPFVDLGTGRTATAITAGANFTCALLDNGRVKCWGYGQEGSLGTGETSNHGNVAGEMGDNLPYVDLGTGRTATAITAGALHTCALLDNAQVRCWGYNDNGELGIGNRANRGDTPGEMGDALPSVDLGTARSALAVTAGDHHNCAVLDNATLKCWGYAASGRLGNDSGHGDWGDEPGEMGDDLPIVQGLSGGIDGTVTTTAGAPLTGVLVAALRASDLALVAMAPDVGSTFLMDLPPGQYYLYAIEKTAGYRSGFQGSPTPVTVTGDQRTPVQVALAPAKGSIAGTVTDATTGNPVAGAWVAALTSTSGTFERGTTADASGHFTIDGLNPGTHLVLYLDRTGAHPARFHPNAPSATTATHLAVTAGATTDASAAIDAQAAPASGTGLAGSVVENNGAAIGGAWVIALRESDFTLMGGTTTSGRGDYTLPLPPGSYRVGFIDPTGAHAMEWAHDQPASSIATSFPITAPGRVSAHVDRTTGDLTGRITTTGGTPLPAGWVVALGANGIAGAATQQDSAPTTYLLRNLPPGQYRALFINPPVARTEYWLDAATYDAATPFTVTHDMTTTVDGTIGP